MKNISLFILRLMPGIFNATEQNVGMGTGGFSAYNYNIAIEGMVGIGTIPPKIIQVGCLKFIL